MKLIENSRSFFAQTLGPLSVAVRVAIVILACVVAGGLIFWLCNEVVYFYLARSYADEIADAYDLNSGFARALLWASFAAIVVLGGYTFSLSKQKRQIGYAGILTLIVGHSVLLGLIDRNFRPDGKAEKCYVITRTSIKTLNRVGKDPETGLECRPITPQMAEKIELYKSGHRPKQITSTAPTFFDPTTGEPVVWYSKNDRGQIELYDLMGFNPQTADELIPVTRDVVQAWRQQAAKVVRRVPVRVNDPEKVGFFEPTTGAAKIWYWQGQSGEYEFYDGPGFHPTSGDAFKIVTRDVIADWHKQQEAILSKQKAEQAQKEKDALEAAERERQEREAAAKDQQQRLEAGNDCDRLAANPTDAKRVGEGTSFEALKYQADQAYDACTKAVTTFPNELRYQYQLGRAAQFKDKKQAFDIFFRLVQANYAAAFDNLGGMYLWDRKDATTAITLFKRGSALGDADSMVSLVDLIDKGLVPTPDPEQTKLALLQRAAELGHAGAQRGYELELQKLNQARVNIENQQQMMRMFGAFVQGVARH